MESNLGLNIQGSLTQKIIQKASHGECMLLFGPPGIGKTLIFQNLSVSLPHELKIVLFNGDELAVKSSADLTSEIKKVQQDLEKDPESKLIVVIDHLESIEGLKYQAIFLLLKTLRETARHRVSLIFATDSNLKTSQLDNYGVIKPYLIENTLFIGPLSNEDAQKFALQIQNQFETKIDKLPLSKILVASGGVPRIIKRLVKLYADGQNIKSTLDNPSSDIKLTHDLESLAKFFQNNPDFVFPVPLLSQFKGGHAKSAEVILEVQFSEQLSRQEHDLFVYLYNHKGEICSREDLIKAIWPKNLYETSEHALDQMIHRLRSKLETASPKCSLITFRGRGAKLVA